MTSEEIRLIVDDSENERIDVYIRDNYEESRSKIQNQIKEGNILVNNERIKANYKVKDGDIISFSSSIFKLKELKGENLDLKVVYEDEYLAVIFKPKGMLTHPTTTIREHTLVNALLYKYNRNGLSNLNGYDRPGIVHRLDMDTSGLLVIAKNNDIHEKLSNEFKSRNVKKYYLAITYGEFDKKEDIIESFISRSSSNRKRMESSINGKYAKSKYWVIDSKRGYSLVLVKIYTGRTHQMRVHMNDINHPLVGDKLYFNRKSEFNVDSQLLNSYELSFIHPVLKKQMTFSHIPDDEFMRISNILKFNFKNIEEIIEEDIYDIR